jgi:hypothetical protein
MSQNVVTTISASKKTLEDTPSNSNPPTSTTSSTKQASSSSKTTPNPSKTKPSDRKAFNQAPKPNASSMPLAKMEYDFLEDMNNTKSKISLFELIKIPQIQENFIKNMQGKISICTKKINVGMKKGMTKTISSSNNTPSKIQVAMNASLTRQRSISTTPPFLVTFEIFNRNVHNCMVDSGDPYNVMPLNVCEKFNVKPEPSSIHIAQLHRT